MIELPKDLTVLSKEELQKWHDAELAVHMIREEGADAEFNLLRGLCCERLEAFQDSLRQEEDRRDAIQEEEALKEFESEPEVAPEDPAYRDRAFRRVLASLVRLVKLRAPDVIILNELKILNNRKPILEELDEKLMKAIFAPVSDDKEDEEC